MFYIKKKSFHNKQEIESSIFNYFIGVWIQYLLKISHQLKIKPQTRWVWVLILSLWLNLKLFHMELLSESIVTFLLNSMNLVYSDSHKMNHQLKIKAQDLMRGRDRAFDCALILSWWLIFLELGVFFMKFCQLVYFQT